MLQPMTMVSDEKSVVSVTILDKGGEPFASVPPGYTVTIESSSPTVVGVAMRPDGISADLSSDDVGTSTIKVSTTKPDGAHLANSPDSALVTVVNAAANSQNATFSAPEPE